MKRITLCFLAFLCAGLRYSANAQLITGNGTPGTIPVFTRSSRIGDSKILLAGDSVAIGTTTERLGTKLEVVTDSTTPPQPGQGPAAIFGEATGDIDLTVGVFGLTSAESGNTLGVAGATFSPAGQGVSGNNASPVGGGGGGVFGVSSATSGYSFGARGDAIGSSGFVIGVEGITNSPEGAGGYFVNRAGGNILVGVVKTSPDVPVFRVDGRGTVFADGGFRPYGADFAESMEVNGDRSKYAAGDLLVIDPKTTRRLALAQQPYSTLVAGIYSTKPGMLGSTHELNDAPADEIPLAVVGIVPCKVTTENGPIDVGDLLVTSPTPGHAMKGTDRNRMLGAVVGKALEPLPQGMGVIQVLVTLQ